MSTYEVVMIIHEIHVFENCMNHAVKNLCQCVVQIHEFPVVTLYRYNYDFLFNRLYWTPAPPKMHLVPATIKSQLFPEYEGALLLQESLGTELRTVTAGFDSDDDDDETEADVETRGDKARSRLSISKHIIYT